MSFTYQQFGLLNNKNRIESDNRKINELEKLDWNVVVIWQCKIKTLKNRAIRFLKLISEIERK